MLLSLFIRLLRLNWQPEMQLSCRLTCWLDICKTLADWRRLHWDGNHDYDVIPDLVFSWPSPWPAGGNPWPHNFETMIVDIKSTLQLLTKVSLSVFEMKVLESYTHQYAAHEIPGNSFAHERHLTIDSWEEHTSYFTPSWHLCPPQVSRGHDAVVYRLISM